MSSRVCIHHTSTSASSSSGSGSPNVHFAPHAPIPKTIGSSSRPASVSRYSPSSRSTSPARSSWRSRFVSRLRDRPGRPRARSLKRVVPTSRSRTIEQRPPLPQHVEGPRDRAVLAVSGILAHHTPLYVVDATSMATVPSPDRRPGRSTIWTGWPAAASVPSTRMTLIDDIDIRPPRRPTTRQHRLDRPGPRDRRGASAHRRRTRPLGRDLTGCLRQAPPARRNDGARPARARRRRRHPRRIRRVPASARTLRRADRADAVDAQPHRGDPGLASPPRDGRHRLLRQGRRGQRAHDQHRRVRLGRIIRRSPTGRGRLSRAGPQDADERLRGRRRARHQHPVAGTRRVARRSSTARSLSPPTA